MPIFSKQKQVLGLWLEQLESTNFTVPVQEMPILLRDSLMPAYGIAWERLHAKFSFSNWYKNKKTLLALLPILLILSLIPIPLRISAPCEIISDSSHVIRSPLNGVVKEILVTPGQTVTKDTPLLAFDAELLEHALEASKEDVQEKKLEFERSLLLGLQNKQSLNDLNLLNIKLQKEKTNLALAAYEASLLTLKSPQDGIVMIDSPDDWRGHPVAIGEKILTISDPKSTKIKIWIPESDNVPLDASKPIKIYLNVFPSRSYEGKIDYIANEVSLSDRDVPSYIAKAVWAHGPPQDVMLGLKGTAILYGDSVPLAYYIMRKPWYTFRNLIGF